jgi:putative ABC transport system permease protein
VDWRWVGFAAVLALSTCVLFGLAPALYASRVPPRQTMNAGGRSLTAGRMQLGLQRALVATQVAMALVLLVAGLLFGRSFFNLLTLDAGFLQSGILEADIDMTRLERAPDGQRALQQELAEAIRAIPDVEAVSTASTVPLVGNWYQRVVLPPLRSLGEPRRSLGEGGQDTAGPRRELANFNRVSGGYFDTLRTPIIAGRDFDTRDIPGSPRVAIVNESFVRRFLGGTSPLGISFQLEGSQGKPGAAVQIVGIVKDTKYGSLREDFKPVVYLAESQNETAGPFAQFLIRARSPSSTLRPAVARALASQPRLAFHFHDFQAQIRYSIRQDRLMATLCGFFAALGALLAALGVYGVNAYAVAQRTNEIGLRVALGADRRAILALILREAGRFVAAGLLAGTAVAVVTARALRSMLFGLQPHDPATLLAAVLLLSTAALAASYFPARRAARVDPMVALRAD